ncbi:uncharacterized protein LOC142317593 [Lycorma delicatula]|uniref:uncharacterized protein LOC142317593 n=1 Tax=Lycorma delicatula TaxID=130591 RepID=UPI003F50E8AE
MFFELCETDYFVKTLYSQVPSCYTWQNNKFVLSKWGGDVEGWQGIKKDPALGRVYSIHPNNVEWCHLHLLLQHVRGPTSCKHLKSINNIEYPTFKAPCKAHGLLEDDQQWDFTLAEDALCRSPYKLQELFYVMLIF